MSTYIAVDVQEDSWFKPSAPYSVTSFTNVSSGTFQCATPNRGVVYEIISNVAIMWLRGTGSSVTVTNTTGGLLAANVAERFVPVNGAESVGWKTVDGTTLTNDVQFVKIRPVGFTY